MNATIVAQLVRISKKASLLDMFQRGLMHSTVVMEELKTIGADENEVEWFGSQLFNNTLPNRSSGSTMNAILDIDNAEAEFGEYTDREWNEVDDFLNVLRVQYGVK